MSRRPPRSPLFPYTTLFRSLRRAGAHRLNHATPARRPIMSRPVNENTPRVVALAVAFFGGLAALGLASGVFARLDRKSTRLNSSHGYISYAVFCLKKKKKPLRRWLRDINYSWCRRCSLKLFPGCLPSLQLPLTSDHLQRSAIYALTVRAATTGVRV